MASKVARSVSTALLCILLFAACASSRQGNEIEWKQGPAIALPHTVATVRGLTLKLNKGEQDLSYVLLCEASTRASRATISLQTGNPNAANDLEVLADYMPVRCEADQAVVGTGLLKQVRGLSTGEVVHVSMKVEQREGDSGVVTEETVISYQVGTDGRLRKGLGSVWR